MPTRIFGGLRRPLGHLPDAVQPTAVVGIRDLRPHLGLHVGRRDGPQELARLSSQ
ncbi:MAG: hypothetical protein ACT4NY_16865 [Pseudonocardiales bacterium]